MFLAALDRNTQRERAVHEGGGYRGNVSAPYFMIGKNSMVAAMSFVNEDVEDNTLEGGVPIHIIKHYKRVSKK